MLVLLHSAWVMRKRIGRRGWWGGGGGVIGMGESPTCQCQFTGQDELVFGVEIHPRLYQMYACDIPTRAHTCM